MKKNRKTFGGTMKNILDKSGIGLALALLIVILTIASPYFLTVSNGINILMQCAISIVVAVGMTFVILTGGIDLSVGSNVALCGMIFAMFAKSESNIFLCIVLTVAVGIIIGVINGFFVARLNIPSFIVTLGMMNVGRGCTLLVIDGQSIVGLKELYRIFGNMYIGSIPVITMIAIFMLLVAWYVLRNTKAGRYIYAIGGNKEATRLSGINVKGYEMGVYIISGFLCAVASMMLVGRLNVADPNAGSGYEMDAIAATIIGGTSMAGGRGSIFGTLMGAIFMVVLKNGLNLLGVSSYIQQIVIGLVVILAVYIDTIRKKIASKA